MAAVDRRQRLFKAEENVGHRNRGSAEPARAIRTKLLSIRYFPYPPGIVAAVFFVLLCRWQMQRPSAMAAVEKAM